MITSCPAATADAARALPMRPLEALVRYRTGSRYCLVGPEVINMRAMQCASAGREAFTSMAPDSGRWPLGSDPERPYGQFPALGNSTSPLRGLQMRLRPV